MKENNAVKDTQQAHDFNRTEKCSVTTMEHLTAFHQNFADLARRSWTFQTRSPLQFDLVKSKQILGQDFVPSLGKNSYLVEITLDPLPGSALLEIPHPLGLAIIGRLCGGVIPNPVDEGDFTPLEIGLLEGQVVRLLGCLRDAWSNWVELKPRLNNQVSPGLAVETIPVYETAIVFTFHVQIDGVSGQIPIAYPWFSLATLLYGSHLRNEPASLLFGDEILTGLSCESVYQFSCKHGACTTQELTKSLASGKLPTFKSQGKLSLTTIKP